MAKIDTNKIRSVDHTCQVLEALQELDGAGVTQLANHLGYSKSTIHRHLATLEANRLIVKEGNQYRLSLRFLDIAAHVQDQFSNYDIIRKELENLAEKTGEVAQFAIMEHGRVSYLYKAKGEQGVVTASRVGMSQPIHSTALGKAILAHKSQEEAQEILNERGMESRTENTITNPGEFFEELEQTRERGYALDDEENVVGLRCIAAPVQSDDDVLGAVSVSGPSSRFSGEKFREQLPTNVMRSTNVIELNTKFS